MAPKAAFVAVTVVMLLMTFYCVMNAESTKNECSLEKYQEDGVVPDVIAKVPEKQLQIHCGGVEIVCGDRVEQTTLARQPEVEFEADPNKFYALIMIDPDAPSRQKPSAALWLHWLVTNIPGSHVSEGRVDTEYSAPTPPSKTNYHRYVLLVYEQTSRLEGASYMEGKGRPKFNLKDIVDSLKLKGPIAGNYFLTQHQGDE